MPNIREFDAGNLAIRPSETGVEAFAAAGRRIGAFSNQAAGTEERLGASAGQAIRDAGDAAVAYEDHREISHGAATLATVADGLTKQWNDTAKNADPNDPSVAAKFRAEVVEPALDQFKSGFNTEVSQKWAEAHTDALRTHLLQKTNADMSTLAGNAVTVNTVQTINQLSNTVRDDPSSVDYALKTFDTSVDGIVKSSPTMTPETASRVSQEVRQKGKEAIVKSAVMGAIEKNPEAGVALSQDPRFSPYITGAEVKQFEGYARTQQRIAAADDRAQRVQRDYDARARLNDAFNQLELSTLPAAAGERPQLPANYWDRVRQIAKDNPIGAALEPARVRAMVTNGEALTERLNKPEPLGLVSHKTTMQLLGSMRARDGSAMTTNGPIYDAYQRGELKTSDFHFLVGEFNSLRTPEGQALDRDRTNFFRNYATQFDTTVSPGQPSAKLYVAEMSARQQEGVLRQKGLDPHLVYDPRSEYFFGKPENVAKFSGSLQEALHAAQPPAATPPAGRRGAVQPDIPESLRGIAVLEYNGKRQQFRDQTTGRVYNRDGTPVAAGLQPPMSR